MTVAKSWLSRRINNIKPFTSIKITTLAVCCAGTDMSPGIMIPLTAIPDDLFSKLSTRARNALISRNILSCEQLSGLEKSGLSTLRGVGTKTAGEIEGLLEKIFKRNQEPAETVCAAALPQCRQKSAPRRPDATLLSRTLPEALQLSPPCEGLQLDQDGLVIGNLGISGADIDRLRAIAVFPEDPADLLYSLSIGYLLQANLSDDAVSVIVTRLADSCGITGDPWLRLSTAEVSGLAICRDLRTELFQSLQIPDFAYPELVAADKPRTSGTTWGDIATISERSVFRHMGSGIRALRAIQYLWQLTNQALDSQSAIEDRLPAEAYRSCEKLADAYLRFGIAYRRRCRKAPSNMGSADREYWVLKARFGLIDEQQWTLAELAQRAKVTRERIRQIEKVALSALREPAMLKRLEYFWLWVDQALTLAGGVASLAELSSALQGNLNWSTPPAQATLASLIALSAKYQVLQETPVLVTMRDHKCLNCPEIGVVLSRALDGQPSGMLPLDRGMKILRDSCLNLRCRPMNSSHSFSQGFLHFLKRGQGISSEGQYFFNQRGWSLTHGTNAELLENFVRNSGKAMHFTTICREFNKIMPEKRRLSARATYSALQASPSLLMWGAGTVIHRDLVSVPKPLLAEIEREIVSRLETDDLPYLSIVGIFSSYRKILEQSSDIPNQHALYSCLKLVSDKLDCPDYPFLLKRGAEQLRPKLPLVLEAFVLKQKVTSTKELTQYAVEKLCMNKKTFIVSYPGHIPNVLRITGSQLIHSDNVGLIKEGLKSILDHRRQLLTEFTVASAGALYSDNEILCEELGISTPKSLFLLIRHFHPDLFEISQERDAGAFRQMGMVSLHQSGSRSHSRH